MPDPAMGKFRGQHPVQLPAFYHRRHALPELRQIFSIPCLLPSKDSQVDNYDNFGDYADL